MERDYATLMKLLDSMPSWANSRFPMGLTEVTESSDIHPTQDRLSQFFDSDFFQILETGWFF
jgi:hypothetical protein